MPNYTSHFTARIILLLCGLAPFVCSAHVRWFAPTDLPPVELPHDSTCLGLFLLIFAAVVTALGIRYYATKQPFLGRILFDAPPFPYRWLWYLLLGFINLFMIINLLYGEFLAPNLTLPLDAVVWGVIIQAAVLVVMPWSVSLVGVSLTFVAILLFSMFPYTIALDYVFEFAGVGLALILVGPSLNKNDHKLADRLHLDADELHYYAVHVLRFALGAQLLELAVQNKLMNPESALWFIENNPFYNFFPAIGLPQVTHLHFVLFVGLSETILGIMLILNISRRPVLLMLLLAFTATAILSGGHELTGHIPIMGVILVLLAEPAYSKNPFAHHRRKSYSLAGS